MTDENRNNQQVNPVRKGGALDPATLSKKGSGLYSSQPPQWANLSNGVNDDLPAQEQPATSEQPTTQAQTFSEVRGEKKEPDVILEINGNFILNDETGKQIEAGKAKFILDEEKLFISSESGKSTSLQLRDISRFSAEDYKINLSLLGGGKVIISELGYQYDDFVKALTGLRHETIAKDLLMKEGGRKAGFAGSFDYQKDGENFSGNAEIEISDTGLVIKPEKGDLIRIPFGEITDFYEKDYKIFVIVGLNNLSLARLGEKIDIFSKYLREALAELSLKTQLILKEFLPELDPITIKKAGELLKDGQAVSKSEIDKISSQIWPGLEKKLENLGVKESYDYLKSLSKVEQISIGIKRDLMGELTGAYIWFLVPVFSEKGGNFLAMEAASTIEGGGKATYFFKIPEGENLDNLVKKINRCMLAINFRREPIYLKDEDLEKPDYLKYKIAINKIPELKLLRQLFVNRVIHTSPENWKKNVNNIINQNTLNGTKKSEN